TAAIVAVTRDSAPVFSPPHRVDEPVWRAATDRSGSLVTMYADAAPTVEDAAPAPAQTADADSGDKEEAEESSTSPQTSVDDLDPTLDEDLTAWFDPDSRVPKLRVLGPVRATAHGNPAAVAR